MNNNRLYEHDLERTFLKPSANQAIGSLSLSALARLKRFLVRSLLAPSHMISMAQDFFKMDFVHWILTLFLADKI